jgi:hypothetical protein
MDLWHRLDGETRTQVAGLQVSLFAEVLDPVEVRFVAVADQARAACLRLTMIMKPVRGDGSGLPPGTTLDVFTVSGFRGIGLARLLWPWAQSVRKERKMGFRPLHRHGPERVRLTRKRSAGYFRHWLAADTSSVPNSSMPLMLFGGAAGISTLRRAGACSDAGCPMSRSHRAGFVPASASPMIGGAAA